MTITMTKLLDAAGITDSDDHYTIDQLIDGYTGLDSSKPMDTDELAAFLDEPHDAISEIADSNTEIYTSKLWELAANNGGEYVERALDEFGEDAARDQSGNISMSQLLMRASYMEEEEKLWDLVRTLQTGLEAVTGQEA